MDVLHNVPSLSRQSSESEDKCAGLTKEEEELNQKRRNEELFLFIDDFINSGDLQAHFDRKNAIPKQNQCVQTCPGQEDENENLNENVEQKDLKNNRFDFQKYPLTGLKLKAYLQERLEKLNLQPQNELLKKQEFFVDSIRQQICNDFEKYKCHLEIRKKLATASETEFVHKICNEFDLNPKKVSPEYTRKILNLKRKMVEKVKLREDRSKKILWKLLNEYKRQQQIDVEKNKTFDYKVKRKERILNDLIVEGKSMTLLSQEVDLPKEDEAEVELVEEPVEEVAKVDKAKKGKKGQKGQKKKGGGKKGKVAVGKVKKANLKKGSKKETKKTKSGKKTKKKNEEDELRIPVAPITNTRERMTSTDPYGGAAPLIEHLDELSFINKDNINYQKDLKYMDTIIFPVDKRFEWTPKVLEFSNYKNNVTYKKKICIRNVGRDTKNCRFFRTSICEQCDDPRMLQVEPVGVIKCRPGLKFCFIITFSPVLVEALEITKAEIVFVTYRKSTESCGHFVIPIRFTPYCPRIELKATFIDFGTFPFWRAKSKWKTLNAVNLGPEPLRLSVQVVQDPLQLDFDWFSIDDDHFQTQYFVANIIEDCLSNVFSSFRFEDYFKEVDGFNEVAIKILLNNANEAGYFFDKVQLNIYDDSCSVGGQELVIAAETTGCFIQVDPEIINLNVCSIDSVRNLNFTVTNDSKIVHRIGLKLPSKFGQYLMCRSVELWLQPYEKREVCVKFVPRRSIFAKNSSSCQKNTSLFEFFLRLRVLTKQHLDAPTKTVQVVGILTDPKSLSVIPPANIQSAFCLDQTLLNFGSCNITEAVWSYVDVVNHSFEKQHFGFLNLPDFIAVEPNYGFGVIEPNESQTLKMFLCPSQEDFPVEKLLENLHQLTKQVTVSTIRSVGGITERCLQSVMRMNEGKSKMAKIGTVKAGQGQGDGCSCWDPLTCFHQAVQPEEDMEEMLSVDEEFCHSNHQIFVSGTVLKPCCDFSYHFVKLPDTPCGSYSIGHVELQFHGNLRITCDCGYLNKLFRGKTPCQKTMAYFEIYGNNSEFAIEPSCGQLDTTQKIKLTIVVKPEIPEELIEERAKAIKREEAMKRKLEEWKLKKEKELAAKLAKSQKRNDKGKQKKGKKEKEKKPKKGKEKKAEPGPETEPVAVPEFEVSDEELELNYLDFYPAEMSLWRSFAEYCVESVFTCFVKYTTDNKTTKEDRIHLRAVCKVIKPDFIHNLELQHIDFGPVAIGDFARKTLTLQNIQYSNIQPTMYTLSPIGPFSCPTDLKYDLEPEYQLNLPITFRPRHSSQFVEYLEIAAGRTICPLILSGEGVECNVEINPSFLVCRLQTSANAVATCTIEIDNQSSAPITVEVVKICDLEGIIDTKPVKRTEPATKAKKGKKAQKKGKKEKPKKVNKFSQELTEDEIYSLENFFDRIEGDSYFQILADAGLIRVESESKKSVTVRFGLPAVMRAIDEKLKNKGKKDKRDKSKSSKSSKSSASGKSSKSSESKKNKKGKRPTKNYVAKFNVVLGRSTLIKDFIVIATFI